ncbi:MAG: glycerol-3-phosphate 1-O-acyltransferase [Oscillatoriales cyanobacterium]|nr:MAG: glycerol-3-phosphate 1-O-acyltransferase [Oscillatoriales cyanobacterium]
MAVAIALGLFVLAYLLGSIPIGYLAGRWLKGIDIRQYGSGSTGATNVIRTVGKPAGITVFILDILKGAIAVWLVRAFWTSQFITDPNWLAIAPWLEVVAGLTAVVGHSKSLWLNFQGGKSVATSLGTLLALSWPVGVGGFAAFCVVLAIWRYVSLGSIVGAIMVSVLMLSLQNPLPYCLFGLAITVFVIARHKSNIKRLLAGAEPKFGQKVQIPDPVSDSTSSS